MLRCSGCRAWCARIATAACSIPSIRQFKACVRVRPKALRSRRSPPATTTSCACGRNCSEEWPRDARDTHRSPASTQHAHLSDALGTAAPPEAIREPRTNPRSRRRMCVTSSLRAKLPTVIAALLVVWALRGGRPEVVHAPFHSYVPIVLDDLLGRYLSAEQQSEEAIKVMQRGLGSRPLGLSGHNCMAALGMCHGTAQALGLPWMDFRTPDGILRSRSVTGFDTLVLTRGGGDA